MGLEQRKGNLYYYRKRRDGERVVSEYVGNSDIAFSLARLSTDLEESRKNDRRLEQGRRDQEVELNKRLDRISQDIDVMVSAAFALAGYHQHNREWRLKR